jgi:hypothetical protein
MSRFPVTRAGAILAVSDFDRSLTFYRDLLGFSVDASSTIRPTRSSPAPERECRWPSRAMRRRITR